VLFVGAFERQLDDKGRLSLPASFRTHLGDSCYLVKGRGKCIDIIPVESFERVLLAVAEAVERGDATLDRQRALAWSAKRVNVDKQGRVLVDDSLCDYAGIAREQQVMVAGNVTRLEIWAPDRFRRVEESGDDDLDGGRPTGPPAGR
jgi:MraZ protein